MLPAAGLRIGPCRASAGSWAGLPVLVVLPGDGCTFVAPMLPQRAKRIQTPVETALQASTGSATGRLVAACSSESRGSRGIPDRAGRMCSSGHRAGSDGAWAGRCGIGTLPRNNSSPTWYGEQYSYAAAGGGNTMLRGQGIFKHVGWGAWTALERVPKHCTSLPYIVTNISPALVWWGEVQCSGARSTAFHF